MTNPAGVRWRPMSEAPRDGTKIAGWESPLMVGVLWDGRDAADGGQCWRLTDTGDFAMPSAWVTMCELDAWSKENRRNAPD